MNMYYWKRSCKEKKVWSVYFRKYGMKERQKVLLKWGMILDFLRRIFQQDCKKVECFTTKSTGISLRIQKTERIRKDKQLQKGHVEKREFFHSSSSDNSFVPPVVFHDTKGTFCLNGSVHPQKRSLDVFEIFYHFLMHRCKFAVDPYSTVFICLFTLFCTGSQMSK